MRTSFSDLRVLNLLGASPGPASYALMILFFIGLFFTALLAVIAAVMSAIGVLEDTTFVILIAIRTLPNSLFGGFYYLFAFFSDAIGRIAFVGLRNILIFFEFVFYVASMLLFVQFFHPFLYLPSQDYAFKYLGERARTSQASAYWPDLMVFLSTAMARLAIALFVLPLYRCPRLRYLCACL